MATTLTLMAVHAHPEVGDLELLGYHDSGMPHWDYKDRPPGRWRC